MTGRLRILEAAALPFPSRQGTQVLLHAICAGLARRGHDVQLLVYAHAGFEPAAPYRILRLPDRPRFRSLRSGPDWRRAALDVRLALALPRLVAGLRPDVVHLHNVEAAAAALLVPRRPETPCVYHAHNLMEHELPTYPAVPALPGRVLGRLLDRFLSARADLTIAVSEPTRAGLVRAGADPSRIAVVEPGIDPADLAAVPVAAGVDAVPRDGATRGTGGRPLRILHLGNLDPYQGIDTVLAAAARMRSSGREVDVVLVTDSDPAPVRERAARLGVPVRGVPHGSLAGALGAARNCDVAALARRVPGGFPVKLVALLHAGVPVAATRSAVDGLDVGDVVRVAAGDDPGTLAEALASAASDPGSAARVARGRAAAAERFPADRAAERIERALRRAAERRGSTRTAWSASGPAPSPAGYEAPAPESQEGAPGSTSVGSSKGLGSSSGEQIPSWPTH
jgi:D-inositol-3-phosphate glycosyltransferase